MPLLSEIEVAFFGIIIIIAIGILIERRASWDNVVGNVLSFLLLLCSIDMSTHLILALGAYMVLGLVIAYYKMKRAFFFFSCKTYGSLSLVILLASLSYFDLSIIDNSIENIVRILVVWLIIAVIVHIIAFIYRWKR